MLVFAAQVFGMAVVESDGLTHLLGHAYLLARAVDESEFAVGEEDGQGDTWEAAAGAEIEDAGAWAEVDTLGDGHRVEHVVLVELVDVLAGYNVNLLVPLPIERVECLDLLSLGVAETGEVSEYGFCVRHVVSTGMMG